MFQTGAVINIPCRSYIHGDGSNSRRYLFAGDLTRALTIILLHGKFGETYNIGSDCEITNLELTRSLLRHFNIADEKNSIRFVEDRAFNDKRYAIDSSKIHSLGWRPTTTFEEGIRITSTYLMSSIYFVALCSYNDFY